MPAVLSKNDRNRIMRYRRRQRRGGLTRIQRAQVKKLIATYPEYKYIEQGISDITAVSGTGVVKFISGVAVGDTNITREGNKINIESVHIKGTLTTASTATIGSVFRILLVEMRVTDGAFPTISNIVTDAVDGMRNADHMGEYRVHWDQTYTINCGGNSAAPFRQVRYVDKYIKFRKPIVAKFDAATAVIGDTTENHLFLIYLSNKANPHQISWDAVSRVVFRE